ncbi:High mobility group B protein 2 [Zostera marina]|uniref:High mobility group B protein 2 n=1 Tax=Zostera marina TaxID=29655 RepID=A0A0K9P890_ZOSMR|nr:High mobility group B protein 2 [Zostera marina]
MKTKQRRNVENNVDGDIPVVVERKKKRRSLEVDSPIIKKPKVGRNKKKVYSTHNGDNDPKKPKKPPTAFFYFLADFRKSFKEQNPDVKTMREIGKACGEKWNTMIFDEKVAYYDIATEKRAAFEKAISEYIKKKESGEESESEESNPEG